MNDESHYLNIADYGNWLYGYIPTGEITAIVHYKGDFIDSYIEDHTSYEETPLKEAFEAYVNDEKLEVGEGSYYNDVMKTEFFHEEGELVSALVGIPQTSKKYKLGFKKEIIDGGFQFPCPILINRYGDLYSHEDYTGIVREVFMNYVKEQRKKE